MGVNGSGWDSDPRSNKKQSGSYSGAQDDNIECAPTPVPGADMFRGESQKVLFCKYCGNRLPAVGAYFCDKCGKRLASPEKAGVENKPAPAPVISKSVDPDPVTVVSEVDDSFSEPVRSKPKPKLLPYIHCVTTNTGKFIKKPVFKIGSKPGVNDLALNGNRYLSREHAEIVVRNGDCFLIDLNSTNKSFINGVRIESGIECKINDGDEIRLANELFYFFIKEIPNEESGVDEPVYR